MPGESDLYEPLCTALERELGDDYECRHGERLAYHLRYDPSDSVVQQSFRADVAVFEDDAPRLVVAVTEGDPTTHELVVYDDKARRHKRTRPFLRYGLVALGTTSGVTRRYLWHTDVLDFVLASQGEPADGPSAVGRSPSTDELSGDAAGGRSGVPESALPGVAGDDWSTFVHLVRRNLEASHRLERVLDGHADHVAMNRAVQFSRPTRSHEPVDAPIPSGE